ncbi:primase-like DNA-binding domain-containing protein [Candidatus Puniceispirillum sp.]|nr:primase-like DNA-binding domain-containing protein [Candidatus Puniceispirillum sp.]
MEVGFLTHLITPAHTETIDSGLLWQANGLSAPASVTASISEYRNEMNTVCSFVDEECTLAAHKRISVTNLYEQYLSWCKSSGKFPRSKVQFGKALTSQGYEQISGSTGRYWRGFSISITG